MALPAKVYISSLSVSPSTRMELRACFLAALLLLESRVTADCVKSADEFYKCEKGTFLDLNEIPDDAARGIAMIDVPGRRVNGSNLFKRFGRRLTELRLRNRFIEDIEDSVFGGLANLRILSLRDNRLTVIKAVWLEDMVSLVELHLGNNNIAEIEDQAFAKLKNLNYLSIFSNRLVKLKAAWFRNTVALEKIYASWNMLEEIEDGTFGELKNLKELHLGNNRLRKANASWFKDTVPLVHLSFWRNAMEEIDIQLIKNAPNLAWLDISDNELDQGIIRPIVNNMRESAILDLTGMDYLYTKSIHELAEKKKVEIKYRKLHGYHAEL